MLECRLPYSILNDRSENPQALIQKTFATELTLKWFKFQIPTSIHESFIRNFHAVSGAFVFISLNLLCQLSP